MKHFITAFALLITSVFGFSQGTITAIHVSPPNPTINDEVSILVDVQFNYGGCEVDNQGFGTSGNTITAYAHHCIGLLTVICETTDTFEVGYLAAGSYTFDFSLSSGQGGPGCSPGIVIDDSDQIQFSVSNSVGVDEIENLQKFAFPNPTTGVLNFPNALSETALITDLSGRIVSETPSGTSSIDISNFSNGVYVFRYKDSAIRILKQ